jgi:hypothetical protein
LVRFAGGCARAAIDAMSTEPKTNAAAQIRE